MISKKFGSIASRSTSSKLAKIATAAMVAGLLAACQDSDGLRSGKAYRPIPAETLALIQEKQSSKNAPILIRTYKKESELEIWKQKGDGTYVHLKTFPMCRWSGQLGPKKREGDRQVPEGFYSITPAQMNPNSNYYLSFNVGYPNAYDRAHGYTGSMIMVHGDCSSAGCYSMTDEQIAEIYALAREAFAGGQQAIQMQSMPFRMTPENLAKHRLDANMPFWKEIKTGYDHFEATKREPRVAVCGQRYVFNAQSTNGGRFDATAGCPPLRQDEEVSALVAEQRKIQDAKVAELVSSGVKPIRMVYTDGGQHPQFAHVMRVSRPEALANGPVEIDIEDKSKPASRSIVAKQNGMQNATQTATPATTPAPSAATAIARSTPQPAAPSGAAAGVAAATAFAPPTTVAAPVPEDKPFYQRWMGINDVLKAEPAASSMPVATTGTTPVATPAAPATRATPPNASRPARAPAQQNSKIIDPRQKTSSLPAIITGAHEPLPSGVLSFTTR